MKIKGNQHISVFVDFDGTITKKDIGDQLFIDYGQFEPYHFLLLNGEMKIRAYWKTVVATLPKDLTLGEISDYAQSFETDNYFVQFAEMCRKNNYSLKVISDGFDAYIKPVLNKLGLNDLDCYINILKKTDNGFEPEFPGATDSCNCLCASCKRNAMIAHTPTENIIVFIGDGNSDQCAAEHADIVFAKKKLAAYCNEKRIPHHPWNTFFDVMRIMNLLADKGSFRHRHQAVLARKRAFEAE
jgi:2,3-diketo-5-methylthio-1-phosphopentane phosphatase